MPLTFKELKLTVSGMGTNFPLRSSLALHLVLGDTQLCATISG
jgi:hypothetical protein